MHQPTVSNAPTNGLSIFGGFLCPCLFHLLHEEPIFRPQLADILFVIAEFRFLF
jgi:hypothetical protein